MAVPYCQFCVFHFSILLSRKGSLACFALFGAGSEWCPILFQRYPQHRGAQRPLV
jgi:hypothetical protein